MLALTCCESQVVEPNQAGEVQSDMTARFHVIRPVKQFVSSKLVVLRDDVVVKSQHRKLEKLTVECQFRISINRAAAERHSIAYRKLLETAIPASQKRGGPVCTRPHSDHLIMESVRVNKELRQRAKDLFAENTTLKAERGIQNASIERLQRSVERLVARKKVLLEEVALRKESVKEK